MERILSDEEKIRRAIEISQRRNNTNYNYRTAATSRVNVNEKKDYKLFKKMILQIIICILIYLIIHLITSTNYAFSADFIKNTNNILNYDVNFQELYNNLMVYITPKTDKNQNIELNSIENNDTINNTQTVENNTAQNTLTNETTNSTLTENAIKEEDKNSESKKGEQEVKNEKQEEGEKKEETAKTQMEKDAEVVAKLCKFQKPLSGTITSEFGEREATIDGMTTDHKGIDIAANSGTSIKAAMEGKVTVAEENSDYGKFIKIVNGDIMTVYAHCKSLKVKVGDKVKIGQTIATVGSTGVSTGPHLHLEIRYKNRYINPRLLIKF